MERIDVNNMWVIDDVISVNNYFYSNLKYIFWEQLCEEISV